MQQVVPRQAHGQVVKQPVVHKLLAHQQHQLTQLHVMVMVVVQIIVQQ